MTERFFSKLGIKQTTKNMLLLYVSEPRSEDDKQAVTALSELDPTVKVRALIPGYDECDTSPTLDAILYDRSLYDSLDGILGFIEQVRRDQMRARIMYTVLAALPFDGGAIPEDKYEERLHAVQAEFADLPMLFSVMPSDIEEAIGKAAFNGDLLDNRRGLAFGLAITPQGRENLKVLCGFMAETFEESRLVQI